MRISLSAVLNLDLLDVLLLGSYANRKPGLSGANYVGEKLLFSVSNTQLLREQVQCHCHCTATNPRKAQLSLHKYQTTCSFYITSMRELQWVQKLFFTTFNHYYTLL